MPNASYRRKKYFLPTPRTTETINIVKNYPMKFLRRYIFLLITAWTLTFQVTAQIGPYSHISILTCSPGTELYSVFGHSAIRVVDPALHLDLVFNYGTFDFETPHFYAKFIRGRLDYMLSVTRYADFEEVYIQEGRSIFEQTLNLTFPQRQLLFQNLMVNYQPENRFYRYDFFWDNCATRVRDIINKSLHDSLRFDTSAYSLKLSFRQLIDPYISQMKWIDLGIDLALGSVSDRIARPQEYMFLPDYILDLFRNTYLQGDEHAGKKLTSEMRTLYEAPPKVRSTSSSPGPEVVLWIMFGLIALLTIFDLYRKKRTRWVDVVMFTLVGLLGWFLTFLWVGTDHRALNRNLNLVWAIPLFFPASLLLIKMKRERLIRIFFTFSSALLVLLMVAWYFIHQCFSPYLPPLIMALLLRSLLYSIYIDTLFTPGHPNNAASGKK